MHGFLDLSIVIPVYNLNDYVIECVESIFPTTQSVEIILVDDGSADQSAEVCDILLLKHPEIIVIHKKNRGASDSRNVGMKTASKQWLMYIDGDDFVSLGAVDGIANQIDVTKDITLFNYFSEYYGKGDAKRLRHLSAEALTDKDGHIGDNVFCAVSPLPMPWLYVISRDYIVKNNIYMCVDLLDEDEEWTARLFANLPTVKVIEDGYYMYRSNREGSLTYSRKLKNSLADIKIIRILQDEVNSGKYSKTGCTILENKRRQMINKVLDDYEVLDKREYRKVHSAVSPFLTLLRSGNRAEKMYYYLDPLLGRKNAKKAVDIFVKVKGLFVSK